MKVKNAILDCLFICLVLMLIDFHLFLTYLKISGRIATHIMISKTHYGCFIRKIASFVKKYYVIW